jgi:hypothetical protein
LRTDDTVNREPALLLELLDRGFRTGAVAPINTTHVISNQTHSFLRTTNRQSGRTQFQHRLALISLININPCYLANGAVGRNKEQLSRQHAADQCLPRDRTDNPIHDDRWNVERQSVLEASDRTVRLRSEDSIHLEPFAGFARTELEFLLDAANRVAIAALFHLNY